MALFEKTNAVYGGAVAFLSFIFGDHWVLFAIFLALNITDFITRWITARITKTESSARGLIGILKKIGYWLMILVAFMASTWFVQVGDVLGIDLHITTLLGWFVLASLTVNEFRSVLENLVEGGFAVPQILMKGLEVADKMINTEDKKDGKEEKKDV